MSVTAADVTARAKEFVSLTVGEINAAIADALLQINVKVWGKKADLATIYLAAHNLSVQNPLLARPVGPVSEEAVVQVRRSYAVAVSARRYGDTFWGSEYLRLLRQLPSWLVT